jgi:hypothetical protein
VRGTFFFRSSTAGIVAVALGALLVAGCGGDSDSTKTLSFVAPAKGTNLNKIDLGRRGPSQGDLVVFDSPLVKSGGQKPVGHVFGTQTAITVKGSSEVVQAMITFDLGGGNKITVGGVGQFGKGGAGLVPSTPFVRPILGGTGSYAGATGSLTSIHRPNGDYEQTFSIKTD